MENKRWILVIGGTSKIGRMFVQEFAKLGFSVFFTYFSSVEQSRSIAGNAVSKESEVRTYKCDLRVDYDIVNLFKTLKSSEIVPEVMINCAAEFEEGNLFTSTFDLFESTLRINTSAPLLLMREFSLYPGKGCIINILDALAETNSEKHSIYFTTKRFLKDLTIAAALELSPSIRVNAVAPSVVFTDEKTSREFVTKISKSTPLRHQIKPDALIQAVNYLIESESVTGQILNVDGGLNLIRKF